jgi:hypothetical protein
MAAQENQEDEVVLTREEAQAIILAAQMALLHVRPYVERMHRKTGRPHLFGKEDPKDREWLDEPLAPHAQ